MCLCLTGRQTQNPERGRKLVDAKCLDCDQFKSSDPKPREGTETLDNAVVARLFPAEVVRPKTPRGDGNVCFNGFQFSCPSGRQTQNPERGRKHWLLPGDGGALACRRQTQNPERGRKPSRGRSGVRCSPVRRQTQNPERGRKLLRGDPVMTSPQVVRPKTPRGDGNITTRPDRCRWRQVVRVVRPKTPRGDGNQKGSVGRIVWPTSSDPKPREGTETIEQARVG